MFALTTSNQKSRKLVERIKMAFRESDYKITDSGNLSEHGRTSCRKHQGNTLIRRFSQGI